MPGTNCFFKSFPRNEALQAVDRFYMRLKEILNAYIDYNNAIYDITDQATNNQDRTWHNQARNAFNKLLTAIQQAHQQHVTVEKLSSHSFLVWQPALELEEICDLLPKLNGGPEQNHYLDDRELVTPILDNFGVLCEHLSSHSAQDSDAVQNGPQFAYHPESGYAYDYEHHSTRKSGLAQHVTTVKVCY